MKADGAVSGVCAAGRLVVPTTRLDTIPSAHRSGQASLARHPQSPCAVGSKHSLTWDGMDPLAWVLSIASGFVALGYIAKVIARTVVQLRELKGASGDAQLAARLERMESALEAIAIEVERAGELQRFTARLQQGETVEVPRAALARTLTPHLQQGASPEVFRAAIARPITPH